VIENIENLFIQISHLKKEILKQYEKEILELIFSIVKKIIHDQAELDEKTIKNTVFKALNLTAEKSEIVLRVNPEDFDFVERLRPEFFTKFKELKSITATSDPSITRGSCFLETPYGNVDATVETRLEKIYQSLEGVRKLET
jgi:flagellar assembly protein FliH